MAKFFVENNQIKDDIIEIIGEDVNHIAKVLRLENEDNIFVCNKNTAITYKAKIMEMLKDKIIAKILEEVVDTRESKVNVTIFQGLPKADKMEYIIQKSTELGVKKIVPVEMKRCVVKLDEKDKVKKLARWQKIAESAAKQSGRDAIPELNEIVSITNLKERIKDFNLFLVAYEGESTNTLKFELQYAKRTIIDKENIKIGVVIGPEGGFEEKEIEELCINGAKVVTLGKRILRTETASLAVLSNIMYEYDE